MRPRAEGSSPAAPGLPTSKRGPVSPLPPEPPEYIRNDPALPGIVRHFLDSDKPIAAICHAALVLMAVEGSLAGRRVTAYPALKPDLLGAGAEYVDEEVVVDGKLVTSRA